jgi:hypothetical protein
VTVECPDCGQAVTPSPKASAPPYFAEARWCVACDTDLVGRGAMRPPAKPKRPEREASIQRRILTYLNGLGPEVYAWRNSVGFGEVGAESKPGIGGMGYGVAQQGGRMVRFGVPGAADIMCCAWGQLVAIEVKSAVGRQSDLQRAFERRIEGALGRYVLARSVQDVQFAIDEVRASRAASYNAGLRAGQEGSR